MNKKQTLCNRELHIGPGLGVYVDVEPVEQWFTAILCGSASKPSTGSVTFGDMYRIGGKQYYPNSGTGYATVQSANIEAKPASSASQGRGVVTFFAQPSTGCLAIVNDTNVDIMVVLSAHPRVILD
jgi:hypothetical protein